MGRKRKSRIRQDRTEFQKVFDQFPGRLRTFAWHDSLIEVLHISMALVEKDYQTVKTEFFRIRKQVLSQYPNSGFHFNLSHTIKLIRQDVSVLKVINEGFFKKPFDHLLTFYFPLFQITPISKPRKKNLLIPAY
jgi:hypothetical protein